mgnify:CR=1 FL=1
MPRFVIDEHFIHSLMQDKSLAKKYLDKLKDIHTTSTLHPWSHNTILDSSFKNAINNNKDLASALLGAMHPVPFFDSEGLHTSVIKHSINVADKEPYSVCILTSSEHCENYAKNKHYADYVEIKSAISIEHGRSALELIDRIHDKLTQCSKF